MKSKKPTYSFKGSFLFLFVFILCLGILLYFEDEFSFTNFFFVNNKDLTAPVNFLEAAGFIILIYLFSISWFGFVRRELIRIDRRVFSRSIFASGFLVLLTNLYFSFLAKADLKNVSADAVNVILTFIIPGLIFITAIFLCFSWIDHKGILYSFASLIIFSLGISLFYFILWIFSSMGEDLAGELSIYFHNSILVFSLAIRLFFILYLSLGVAFEIINYKKIKVRGG